MSTRQIKKSISLIYCTVMCSLVNGWDIKNFKIYIDIIDSDYEQYRLIVEEECRRGMAIWETVLPELNVTFVDDPQEAEAYFVFANYHRALDFPNPAPEYPNAGPRCGNIWAGCAPTGDVIYFNTHYATGHGTIAPNNVPLFVPDPSLYDELSIHDYYQKWQPATKPPRYYKGDLALNPDPYVSTNEGHTRGYSENQTIVKGKANFSQMVAHEFGHWVGVGDEHGKWTNAEILAWYGIPYPKGGDQPESPQIVSLPNTSDFDLFFNQEGKPLSTFCLNSNSITCDYYGGANCPNFSDGYCHTSDPTHPMEVWQTDFHWDEIADKLSFMRYGNESAIAPGLPLPTISVNLRFINDYDLTYLDDSHKSQFPEIDNVIVMKKQGSDDIFLTSNWHVARAMSKYDVPMKYDYDADKPKPVFLVVDVKSKILAKTKFSAGGEHVSAIRDTKKAYSWGKNSSGQLGIGHGYSEHNIKKIYGDTQDWDMVSAGGKHSCAIKLDGTLWCWGDNTYGQIGAGIPGSPKTIATQVGTDNDWYTVAAGQNNTIGLKRNGEIWQWGYCYNADGSQTTTGTPVRLSTEKFTAISSESSYSVALSVEGQIWAWGQKFQGQIQNLSPISSEKFEAISSGAFHYLALKKDGTVWSWGDNDYGQLGYGHNIQGNNIIEKIPNMTDIVFIEAGGNQSFAIKNDGTLFAWGDNTKGQLGLSNQSTQGISFPTQVGSGKSWIAISAGKEFTLGQSDDAYLYSWGSNEYYQLGDDTDSETSDPSHKSKFESRPIIEIIARHTYKGYPVYEPVIAEINGTVTDLKLYQGNEIVSESQSGSPSWTSPENTGDFDLRLEGVDILGEVVSSAIHTVSIDLPHINIYSPLQNINALTDENSSINKTIMLDGSFNISNEVLNRETFFERVEYSLNNLTFVSNDAPHFPWDISLSTVGIHSVVASVYYRGGSQNVNLDIEVNKFNVSEFTPLPGTIFNLSQDQTIQGWYHWGENDITFDPFESASYKTQVEGGLLYISYSSPAIDPEKDSDIGFSWNTSDNGIPVTNSKNSMALPGSWAYFWGGYGSTLDVNTPLSIQFIVGVSKATGEFNASAASANGLISGGALTLSNPNEELIYKVFTVEMYRARETTELNFEWKLLSHADENEDGFITVQVLRVKEGMFETEIPFGGHLVSGVMTPLLLQ